MKIQIERAWYSRDSGRNIQKRYVFRETHNPFLFFPIFRFFNGETGAFTLFEATPESLNISQIDDKGKEVYSAELKPRTILRSMSDNENTILDEFFTSQT